MTRALFTRPSLVVEPLFNRWHAWAQLIAPATAALHHARDHLKTMRSYVKNPELHRAAAERAELLGAPVIDLAGDRVAEIERLIQRGEEQFAELIELANALVQLPALLEKRATGGSLEPIYAELPPCLRGFVELSYDAHHRPRFRLYEPLLYRSRYYRRDAQSVRLSLLDDDRRPFVLSTPRLPEPGTLELSIPFAHPGLDRLFSMRNTPASAEVLAEALELPSSSAPELERYLTDTPPRPPRAPELGDAPRWRYFGHACVLFETREVSLLFDPLFSYEYPAASPRFTTADLPERLDYVVITHGHQDHLVLESLLPLRSRIGTVVVPKNGGDPILDPSLKLALEHAGFPRVIELGELERLELPGGALTGVPFLGEHGDLEIKSKLCHQLELAGKSALLVTDSDNVDPEIYKRVREALGPVDVLFVGMECVGAPVSHLYGALFTKKLERALDHTRRLNGSDARRASELLALCGAREVYVYAMAQEPWLESISSLRYDAQSKPIVESNRLIEIAHGRGIYAERLWGSKIEELPRRV